MSDITWAPIHDAESHPDLLRSLGFSKTETGMWRHQHTGSEEYDLSDSSVSGVIAKVYKAGIEKGKGQVRDDIKSALAID